MENKKIKKIPSNKSSKVSKNSRINKDKKNIGASKTLVFMNDFAQALVITSIIVLLTISFIIVGSQKRINEMKMSGQGYFDVIDGVRVVKKGKGFFGDLYLSSFSGEKGDSKELFAGDGSTMVSSIDGQGSAIDYNVDMMPYEAVKYNYIYTGIDFNLFSEEVDVYRRVIPDLSNEFSSTFSNKKISFFDMRKFKNININNISINEDREYGYSIYLGLKDGNFSLYKNWERWPSIDKICGGYDVACYQSYQLTMNDVLGDEEVISIANQFLIDYGITLSNYGQGEIEKYWMRDYVLSPDKNSFYIPENITINYPLKIAGKTVFEEYGQKSGLMVEVDMREKRVSGLYNLYYQHYESSVYNTERDKNVILDMVSKGGMYPDYYYEEGNFKTIDIQLGQPSLDIVKIWHYDNITMKGYDIYVPAYVFPVLSESEPSYFYRKNVVIPAVKDFFRQEQYLVPLPAILEGEDNISIFDNSSLNESNSSNVSGSGIDSYSR